ncbi:MAG: hypothetical protein ACW98I_12335 [Candidatus Hodarchaeales archaeon]
MNSSEEFQEGDLRSLTLLKQIWGIWTVLTAFLALYGILLIFMGIINIPNFLRSPNTNLGMGIYAFSAVFLGLIGVGMVWVLFLGNIYIRSGLDELNYFRWKLLVIESGLIGIVMGFLSLKMILNSEFSLQTSNSIYRSLQTVLAALVGSGFWLVTLYLAYNVRDKFRET